MKYYNNDLEIIGLCELFFYGSGNFGNYDMGNSIEKIVPNYHNKIFGVGYCEMRD